MTIDINYDATSVVAIVDSTTSKAVIDTITGLEAVTSTGSEGNALR